MTAEDGLRFMAYQASFASNCDQYQAVLLLLPAILSVTHTRPMNGYEAADFRRELLDALNQQPHEPTTLKDGRAG